MRVEREKRGRTEAKAQNFLRLFIKPNKLRKKKGISDGSQPRLKPFNGMALFNSFGMVPLQEKDGVGEGNSCPYY